MTKEAPSTKLQVPKIGIDQLEALLAAGEADIEILPNGEVRVKGAPVKPLTMREGLGGEYSSLCH